MNLRAVGIIARKDFKDVLRDRRTLFFMMLLPVVVFPLLMMGVSRFIQEQAKARQERVLTVAADPMASNTLRALYEAWYDEHALALGAVRAKLGLDTARGIGGLADLVDLADRVEDAGGEAPVDADATMLAAIAAWRELDPAQRRLLDDARAVSDFIEKTEFVTFDELSSEGALAQGVEIPQNVPPPLGELSVVLAVQKKEIAGALAVPRDAILSLAEAYGLDELLAMDRPADVYGSVRVHVLYDSSQNLSDELRKRMAAFTGALSRFTLRQRLETAGLSREFAEPIRLHADDVATDSRQVQAILGGLLPYLIFAFCFFGALYPALDVTAGEKERFTMETLLLGPVSRFEIAVGKFVVVFVAAIVAAVLTTTSMVVTFTHGILPKDVLSTFEIEFQPLALLLTGSLVLPVAALYASALLAVGVYARSFKEAQSYSVPLQFLFVLPTMVSLFPDVEAESHLAWIPFVNIAMLMKELLKGNYLWSFYATTLSSTVVLTLVALVVTAWLFRRESVLLRT